MTAIITQIQKTLINGGPDISLPLWQILLFVVLVSTAAIFGKHRAIALFCYAFLFQLLLSHNIPIYSMNQPAVIWLSISVLAAIAGLVATFYQMLHRVD